MEESLKYMRIDNLEGELKGFLTYVRDMETRIQKEYGTLNRFHDLSDVHIFTYIITQYLISAMPLYSLNNGLMIGMHNIMIIVRKLSHLNGALKELYAHDIQKLYLKNNKIYISYY